MSHETPDAEAPSRTETTTIPSLPVPAFGDVRTRLRALRHLRRDQFAVLALLAAVVAVVAVAPVALTGFLGLFVATVALLAVAPHVVVRAVTVVRGESPSQ